jgi:hypothetical protein
MFPLPQAGWLRVMTKQGAPNVKARWQKRVSLPKASRYSYKTSILSIKMWL